MKVTLVVASGAHQGKVIPITGSQFLIGRDTQCHLRPASQAISKRHCGVLVRDGQVYVKDFGSTNGTTVNNELLKDTELVVANGATLKLGPLDFIIRIELPVPDPDGTPLPASTPETAAALAAVKAATGVTGPKAPARDATPNPARATKPAGAPGSKEATALKSPPKPASLDTPLPNTASANSSDAMTDADHDQIAAMLLGMDDDSPSVPDGSTVVEVPAVDAQGAPSDGREGRRQRRQETRQTREEMSSARTTSSAK